MGEFYKSHGEGNDTPLQYSCLKNPMDGGAWKAVVHGVAEGRTWLSDFTFTFHFLALEKEMATHSSVLAWRIPEMGKPGGLPSMGSHRVGHNWSDLAIAIAISSKWFTFKDFNLYSNMGTVSWPIFNGISKSWIYCSILCFSVRLNIYS